MTTQALTTADAVIVGVLDQMDATEARAESPDPPGGWGPQSLLIRQIRRDGGTQARTGSNEDTVQEYAELMREQRWDFRALSRPIVLYDGSAFWLADGFHRIEAAQRAGLTDYLVDVIRGTQRDAILRAAGANSQHGLRRTNADKRRAVELLLRDEEWRQWSDRKIAEACAVSQPFVGSIRRDMASDNGYQMPATRTVERSGSTYQMTPALPKPAAGAIDHPDGSPSNGASREIPPDLAGWHWMSNKPAVFQLTNGDYETRQYDHPHHAIVGARNYLASQQPDPPLKRIGILTSQQIATTDMDGPLIARMDAGGYTWQSAAQTPDGRWHHLIRSRDTNLQRWQQIRLRRERIIALINLPTIRETDDQAMVAEIRAKAEALGLGLIWEDDTVILHWPEEDVEQLMGMGYQEALYWLESEGKQQAELRATRTAPADPEPPRPSSARVAAYDAQERADRDILAEATGMLSAARAMLSSVAVAQRACAELDVAIAHEQARAFELTQRDRLTRFSKDAMVSQTTFKQALDHITALLEATE